MSFDEHRNGFDRYIDEARELGVVLNQSANELQTGQFEQSNDPLSKLVDFLCAQ